jgi:hypothetical protein
VTLAERCRGTLVGVEGSLDAVRSAGMLDGLEIAVNGNERRKK